MRPNILYDVGTHFVIDAGKKGFEVYRNGPTAATRCASIGRSLGLQRAKLEADKRHNAIKVSTDTGPP